MSDGAKIFRRNLKRLDPSLRATKSTDGRYHITRRDESGRNHPICQAKNLTPGLIDTLRRGSAKHNPDAWTNHVREQRATKARMDREARQTEIEGRCMLADAIRFDTGARPTVGSSAAYRANFDQIFKKGQTPTCSKN